MLRYLMVALDDGDDTAPEINASAEIAPCDWYFAPILLRPWCYAD